MTQAYLNGTFTALEDAKISPMDRGFLFGDGVYEVMPCYGGQLVAMLPSGTAGRVTERDRARTSPHSDDSLTSVLMELVDRNGGGDLGVYLQITRGAAPKRQHAFPEHIEPTVFAYTFAIAPPSDGSPGVSQMLLSSYTHRSKMGAMPHQIHRPAEATCFT